MEEQLPLKVRIERERKQRHLMENLQEIREKSRKLRDFIPAAWHVLEPLTPYKRGWAIDCMCDHLEAVHLGQILRLVINVPTGMMKSFLVSVFFQAWEWGPMEKAHLRTISTSFAEDNVNRDCRRTRNLVMSEWYQAAYPHVRLTRKGETSFENTQSGWREGKAFGSLTGSRADRVLIDDPHSTKTAESPVQRAETIRNFRESVPTRINDPKTSAILIIMQRLNVQDVSAFALEYGYEHLMLPMEYEPERRCYSVVNNDTKPEWRCMNTKKQIWLPEMDVDPDDKDFRPPQLVYLQDKRTEEDELLFPERFDREYVDNEKKILGSYAAAGQFQQRPAPRTGGMFERSWFKIVRAAPAPKKVVRYTDLAATEKSKSNPDPDWTASVRMSRSAEGVFYVEHAERFRLSSHKGEERLKALASQDKQIHRRCTQVIPQDPGAAGKAYANYLVRMLAGYNARSERETGSKELRAEPFSAQAEAGNVYLVEGPWNEAFLDELCNFPTGHDDQVDAATGAFKELVKRKELKEGALGGII